MTRSSIQEQYTNSDRNILFLIKDKAIKICFFFVLNKKREGFAFQKAMKCPIFYLRLYLEGIGLSHHLHYM